MISNNNVDFEKAINLSSKSFTYQELIELVKNKNIPEKQFGILSLEEIKSIEDGMLLCSNLTGQDGKIRESVSYKICELFKNKLFSELLENEHNFKTMLDGIMDINGNVCRNILDINNECFNYYLSKNLIPKINIILTDISKLNIDDKQYVISKRNFQLYWALECLYKIRHLFTFDQIKHILIKTAEFEDYTIREKTAKIISSFTHEDAKKLKSLLKNDRNYFVNRYLN